MRREGKEYKLKDLEKIKLLREKLKLKRSNNMTISSQKHQDHKQNVELGVGDIPL